MAKNRDILSHYLKHYPKLKADFESVHEQYERDFRIVSDDYADEIEKIKEQYRIFEEDHLRQYLDKEIDFQQAREFITGEYQSLFDRLDADVAKHNEQKNAIILQENQAFEQVLNEIEKLRSAAKNQYLELTSDINNRIDHEMKVHHDFINEEDRKFKSIQKNYQEINSEQANRLLWTIEASKNALIDLGAQLKENSFQHAKYMNESVLKVLESLRETKNKLTVLFKSTTDIFSRQKDKIERLNHERQKPHTQLNQTIIRQYVRQIQEVNQKKTSFEQMIRHELKTSLKIIGTRILRYDYEGNRVETEKAILQYEIVKKKAEYLLHRNQAMSDLLISKYQNEIKKIKIDSFRRVEEIKLAYFMPAAFFQNSINLYSNFAFYVNESFDDLDNLLTDLIRFNQKITEVEGDYIRQSAKTVEDYKIKVMVQVNGVTTRLTDLITKIDVLSKDIITLESNNQLEVAEIRKKMESTDIYGDYQKYLVGLDNDEYFACFQHDINMQKIKSEMAYKEELLEIDRQVTNIHLKQQFEVANRKHLTNIAINEKEIHDLAYDKELAYFFARYDHELKNLTLKEKSERAKLNFRMVRHNFQFAAKYDELRQLHIKNRQEGSQHVVEYVYNTQKLIDLNDSETDVVLKQMEHDPLDRDYGYYLNSLREKTVELLLEQARVKTANNAQAIEIYHHRFFDAKQRITSVLSEHRDLLKRLLINLDEHFAVIQASSITAYRAYLLRVLRTLDSAKDIAFSTISDLNPDKDLTEARHQFNTNYEQMVIISHETLTSIPKAKNKGKRLRPLLEKFYIESLELFKRLEDLFFLNLDQAELSIIESDVLYIQRVNEATQKTIKVVEDEYDHLIYQAVKMGKKSKKKAAHLTHLTQTLDEQLKAKVRKVNAAYMDTMKSEADKLEYIKRSLIKIVRDNEHAMALQDKAEKAEFVLRRKQIDKQYHDFVKAYQRLKQLNEDAYNQEISYINRLGDAKAKIYQDALLSLDQKVVALPSGSSDLVGRLETEKEALVQKRRVDLLQQYAIIEGNKFTSRPKYLKQIEEVKKRLPDDYLALYQKMQLAQKEFLEQYLETETSFSDDFRNFLLSQQNYRKIIETDDITQKPFDDYFKLQTELLNMTTEAYQTTIEKSDMTKAKIKETEAKSKERQERIING
ncbi:MAG: hypothetical protein JXR38_05775 [Bacilli bacterium]|nr:hypothetical protein [Bacilli bacterium]